MTWTATTRSLAPGGRVSSWGWFTAYDASIHLAPQAPLASVQVEPDVPVLPAPVGDNDPAGAPNATPPLWGAAGANILHGIGKRITVPLARPTGDLLGP